MHIAEGYYEGTITHCHNPATFVSPHFVISKEGKITQLVDITKGAWCNGCSTDPANSRYYGKEGTADIVKRNKTDANFYTISIEFVGFYSESHGKMTDAQIDAAAWLFNYVNEKYKFNIPADRAHIIGHYQVTPVTKPNCPGENFQFDELIQKIKNLQRRLQRN